MDTQSQAKQRPSRSRSARPVVVDEFLLTVRPDRQAMVEAIDVAIRRGAPKLTVRHEGKFLGYGPFHYRYASGREGDTFVVSMMDGAQALSVYVLGAGSDGEYLAESNAGRLGKVSVGKACIRVKHLEHLDLDVLSEIVGEAAAQHKSQLTG